MRNYETHKLGLDDLLNSDLTSYELFNAQPKSVQNKIRRRDIQSFDELQGYIAELHRRH